MATENSILKGKALEVLKGKWGSTAVVVLVYLLVSLSISIGLDFIKKGLGSGVSLVVSPVLSYGLALYFLSFARGRSIEMGILFSGFSDIVRLVGTYLLMVLAIIIGFILLVVPGIIVAIGLSQTFFILADDKEIGAVDALKASWEMMKGNKAKFFVLSLSFIGWAILCIFTAGIGFLFLLPYMQTTFAFFYDDINGKSNANEIDEIGVE